MPAKARGTRSAAPSASPAPKSTRSRSSRSDKTADSDSTEDESVGQINAVPTVSEDEQGENEAEAEETGETEELGEGVVDEQTGEGEDVNGKLSMSERLAKMKELRNRMVRASIKPSLSHITPYHMPYVLGFTDHSPWCIPTVIRPPRPSLPLPKYQGMCSLTPYRTNPQQRTDVT